MLKDLTLKSPRYFNTMYLLPYLSLVIHTVALTSALLSLCRDKKRNYFRRGNSASRVRIKCWKNLSRTV